MKTIALLLAVACCVALALALQCAWLAVVRAAERRARRD